MLDRQDSFGPRSFRSINRFALRTPLLGMRSEMILTLIAMALLILVRTAQAENSQPTVKKSTSTTTITTTTTQTSGDSTVADPQDPNPPQKENDFIATATFGSKATTGLTGCKTADLVKTTVRDLKDDCAAWIKEQKTELKGKFQTGTCQDTCSDCGMSLQRCTVTGTVHYAK